MSQPRLDFRGGLYRTRDGGQARVRSWRDGRFRGEMSQGQSESWDGRGNAGRGGPHAHDLMERIGILPPEPAPDGTD